jgi:hypothetical protein
MKAHLIHKEYYNVSGNNTFSIENIELVTIPQKGERISVCFDGDYKPTSFKVVQIEHCYDNKGCFKHIILIVK